MTNQRIVPEQYSLSMLFGHLSNHFRDLFHCQMMGMGVLWGSQAFPRSTNAGLPACSMWIPKRASSADMARMSRSRWWVWGCPWSQHLLMIHFSLLFILPKCILRRGAYFSTKNLSGKSQGFTWLLESQMEGKKRKQNHPVFHKNLKYTVGQSRQRPSRKSCY